MSLQEKDCPPRTREKFQLPNDCCLQEYKRDKVFFVYGFAKNQKDNISDLERHGLALIAKHYLDATDTVLDRLVASGELVVIEEVGDNE